jgi:CRP-like cAMP-binding protein
VSEADADADEFFRRTGLHERDFSTLKRLALFSGISQAQVHELLLPSLIREFPSGTMLFLHGDPADHFYVVFDGWVKLFRETEDGHESVIHVIAPGESFAEAAIFDKSTFPVSAVTVGATRLLIVPAGPFIKRIHDDPDLALNILAAMARRNRQLVHKLEQLTVKSSAERVALFLTELCREGMDGCAIQLPHDKSLIAARLGMQPETLSRSLAKLRAIGVATRSDTVTVDDVVALRRFAAGNGM